MAYTDESIRTFTAGEALEKDTLVRLSGSTLDTIVYCDAGEEPLGVTRKAAANADATTPVKLWGSGRGTFTLQAAAAITVNAKVYPAASGEVTSTPGGPCIGFALQAASAQGELIEVAPIAALSAPRAAANTETLAAGKTLVIGDAEFQFLDAGGAGRTIVLPAEALSAGLKFVIVNTSDAAEILTINDDAAATIATPTQNESAILVCDGVSWAGIVGSA